jgi:chaperonin GroES
VSAEAVGTSISRVPINTSKLLILREESSYECQCSASCGLCGCRTRRRNYYLPEKAAEKPKVAKVVAVGTNAKQVKVGDRIVAKAYSQTEVKVGDTDYIVVKEEDILAIVK